MRGIAGTMKHFQTWAGIQRTRHEHRCRRTQPPFQIVNVLFPKVCLFRSFIDKPPAPKYRVVVPIAIPELKITACRIAAFADSMNGL